MKCFFVLRTILILSILTAVFLIVFSTTGFGPSFGQEDKVRVGSSSTSVNPLGRVTVYGEVVNDGEKYLDNLYVDVRLKNKSDANAILAVKTVNFTRPFGGSASNSLTVPPGARVGFTVTFEDKSLSSKMSTYDFATRYDIAKDKPRTLNVTDSHIYRAGSGNGITNWVILGELKNEGQVDIWDAYALISVHDVYNKVVAVIPLQGPFTQNSPLKAGQSWAFFTNVNLPSDLTGEYIYVYAESKQSVVIPEFPFQSVIFASSISSLLIVMMLIRKYGTFGAIQELQIVNSMLSGLPYSNVVRHLSQQLIPHNTLEQ